VGRVASQDLDGDPRPSAIEIEKPDGGTLQIHLGDAPLGAGWPRRRRLRAGDRISVEALEVARPREEAGYRENAQGSRLEAARIWVGSPPARSRSAIAIALLPLLALGALKSRERPLTLACPEGSAARIVRNTKGGWYGTCVMRYVAHGPWRELDRNGVTRAEGEHCDGDRCGQWIWRGPSGAILEQGGFLKSKRSGIWTRYAPDGRKRSEGRYRDGLQVGIWRYWDARGQERDELFDEGWPASRCEVFR